MNVLRSKGLIEDEYWYGLQFTGDESVGGNLKQVENFFQKIFVSFKIKVSIGYKSRDRVYNIEAEVKKHPLSYEWQINANDYVVFYKLHDYWDMDVYEYDLAVGIFNICDETVAIK